MPSNRPFEQFGEYILLKKLEASSIGEVWRAARIRNGHLEPVVTLRRLAGGDRPALTAGLSAAIQILPHLNGSAFVRQQSVELIDGIPVFIHEYAGGRSLRYIAERARGGKGGAAQPMPLEQGLAIAERVAMSLESLENLKIGGQRVNDGAVLPHFVWVSEEGEARVAGQMLARGLAASTRTPAIAQEIGRYFAPEFLSKGEPSSSSAVYSAGAILFHCITGQEPPDSATSSGWTQAVRDMKTADGRPVPDDVRAILDRSFHLDPAGRYSSPADMKRALSALVHGGPYSATSFNLAFYLSTLLKKEIETETTERENENNLDLVAYLNPQAGAPLRVEPSRPMFAATTVESRSKAPVIIGIAAGVAILGGVGIAVLKGGSKSEAPATPAVAATAAPVKQKIVSAPILAASSQTPAGAAGATGPTGSADPAAQKKAFEEAVNQKLQEEMMKLQEQYTKNLQNSNSREAPLPTSPAAAPPTQVAAEASREAATPKPEEHAPSAAKLDAATRTSGAAPEPARVATSSSTPPPAAVVAAAAPARVVHEGDVIDLNSVDQAPKMIRAARPVYPPIALRQRAEGTVLLTVLVDEKGEVTDVRLLRGDNHYGFADAALRAAKDVKFTPATKDGKRVRTWFPIPFIFKPTT